MQCAILFFNVGLPVRLEEFRQAKAFKADPVRKKDFMYIAGEKLECLLQNTSLSPDEIIKRDILLGSRLELLARHHVVLTNAMGQIA